jgi:hypothetical protein
MDNIISVKEMGNTNKSKYTHLRLDLCKLYGTLKSNVMGKTKGNPTVNLNEN